MFFQTMGRLDGGSSPHASRSDYLPKMRISGFACGIDAGEIGLSIFIGQDIKILL